MIHFDFVVDDVDAENIMFIIQSEIAKCLMRKLKPETTEAEADWFERHAEYLKELKGKMKNTRVGIKCDYHGNLENGEKLVVGKIYKAIDEDGNEGFFRANVSGTLFAMWRVTEDGKRCGGYVLPHYMDFLIDEK